MLIERYADGSMEVLLAYDGQTIDGSVVTIKLLESTASKFNEEGTRHLYHTELGHPKLKNMDLTLTSEISFEKVDTPLVVEDLSNFYAIDLNNVCGVITEMYSYFHEGLNKTILTGVWTPSGYYRDAVIKIIEDVGDVKLGIRSISHNGFVLKIITWDFINPNPIYKDELQAQLGNYGVDVLLEDLRRVATKRKEKHVN